MNEPRFISEQRFLDAGEQDENGLYDYYYSGMIVIAEAGDVCFKVFLYDDEPGIAVFWSTAKGGWTKVEVDPSDVAFRSTVELLVARYRIHAVSIYDPTTGSFKTKDVATLFG